MKLTLIFLTLATSAALFGQGETEYPSAGTLKAVSRGFVNLSQLKPAIPATAAQARRWNALKAQTRRLRPRGFDSAAPAASLPNPAPNPFSGPPVNFFGFNGMTGDQMAQASGVIVEPPDPAFATDGNFIVQAVNLAVQVIDPASGNVVAGPVGLNEFFGLPPVFGSNPDGSPFGPFTSDPKVYYDAAAKRWFMTILEIAVDPNTGNFASPGASGVLLAVSSSQDPRQGWGVYGLDTTSNNHAGCPCFGDQPLLGADANSIVISTNEFPIFNNGFNGAQVYVWSKAQVVNFQPPNIVWFSNLLDSSGNYHYSLQPATTPPGASFASGVGGTEYLMSALDFNNTGDNRVAVWAITNTRSISTSPLLTLRNRLVSVQGYGIPPAVTQRNGAYPLGQSLGEALPTIESNDDRMNQTIFAGGVLWGALTTGVGTAANPRAGIAYFAIQPLATAANLFATVRNRGYIAPRLTGAIFPGLAVNAQGKAVIAYTIAGPYFFPSAAYSTLTATTPSPIPVVVSALGAAPADGFSSYAAFGGNGTGRWGDYSTAYAVADGSIWFTTQYIPNAPRNQLINWGTFFGRVAP